MALKMNKLFNILSSDDVTIYTVDFELDNGKLTVQCNCPAGAFGKLCKHKIQLLSGDITNCKDVSQEDDHRTVMSWVHLSTLPNMIGQLNLTDKELVKMKAQLGRMKKALEKALRDGVSISE